jgi:hypothetical protein
MDDYCFRKIKSTALVMIALAAVHISISNPLGYYWNALQANLSGVDLTVSGVPEAGDQSQSIGIYLLMFGTIALLAFVTSPGRTSIWWRLILIAPLSVYVFSAYAEYQKISPVSEKFQDLYESLGYAIFVPYAAIAAITALYIAFVIALPAFRFTQAFGWVTSVVAILSYLVTAVFIVYNHTMTILDGAFGASEFYTYLAAFALDVVSYFFMLSVLMTYCTIKREERWDRLEALAMEAEMEEDAAMAHAAREPAAPSAHIGERVIPDIGERVIPDIEELKEHEGTFAYGYEEYNGAEGPPAGLGLEPARAAAPEEEAPAAPEAPVVDEKKKPAMAGRRGLKGRRTGPGPAPPAAKEEMPSADKASAAGKTSAAGEASAASKASAVSKASAAGEGEGSASGRRAWEPVESAAPSGSSGPDGAVAAGRSARNASAGGKTRSQGAAKRKGGSRQGGPRSKKNARKR